MMKTEWNLKKHKKNTFDMFIGNPTTPVEKDDYHYDAKDIEVLRRKLIEEIRLNAEGCTQVNEFEHIINKLFGGE